MLLSRTLSCSSCPGAALPEHLPGLLLTRVCSECNLLHPVSLLCYCCCTSPPSSSGSSSFYRCWCWFPAEGWRLCLCSLLVWAGPGWCTGVIEAVHVPSAPLGFCTGFPNAFRGLPHLDPLKWRPVVPAGVGMSVSYPWCCQQADNPSRWGESY